jgi:hypothetical protein
MGASRRPEGHVIRQYLDEYNVHHVNGTQSSGEEGAEDPFLRGVISHDLTRMCEAPSPAPPEFWVAATVCGWTPSNGPSVVCAAIRGIRR